MLPGEVLARAVIETLKTNGKFKIES